MKKFKHSLTPEAVAQIIGGAAIINKAVILLGIADPIEADEHSIVFIDNDKFLSLVKKAKPGLIIAGNEFREYLTNHDSNIIYVNNAYRSVLILLKYWQESEQDEFVSLIHQTAIIGTNVTLPEKVYIGPYTIIRDNVTIGEYTRIESFCSIGDESHIGHHVQLFPNVTIYRDSIIGNSVIIHSGSVIGADGFGYLLYEGIQQKIPQLGQVIIHDNVEIGANSCIDCGTIGSTVIGEGTKIDNLVQVGHNCIIGKHSILCAQVGLAGSTTIGDYVFLAGQVGVAGHLTIGNEVMVGAQSGVVSTIEPGRKFFGSPAREAMLSKKIMAVEGNLPEMYKFFQKLKREREQE